MIFQRLMLFHRQLITLWRAFWHPLTPLYLKVITLLTALYVLSPFDLVPDFVPLLGWADDVIIMSFLVSWIVSRLPRTAPQPRPEPYQNANSGGKTINGTYRRL